MVVIQSQDLTNQELVEALQKVVEAFRPGTLIFVVGGAEGAERAAAALKATLPKCIPGLLPAVPGEGREPGTGNGAAVLELPVVMQEEEGVGDASKKKSSRILPVGVFVVAPLEKTVTALQVPGLTGTAEEVGDEKGLDHLL